MLEKIISDAEQGAPRSFDVLVVPSMCRLSRNFEKVDAYYTRLRQAGIKVTFCDMPLYPDEPFGMIREMSERLRR
ncbi:hypothetical protein DLJ49_21180 [Rhodovulum sp. 12E13]|uniref:recombinase family protein n=1 Tax=Rhodovulum sp. 12E13 TaxID=2203891 RepID=UPI000E1254E1|nr:recombinase family protein [Rhodovulum sp. 12E13]RDC67251.1 hypothetical protein DLJ49_21180 [Rhodovulum sp. 12E13]